MKLIYIEWVDSSASRGPLWERKATEFPSLVLKSGGLHISEDGEVVRICLDYWVDIEGDRDVEVIVKTGIREEVKG